MIGYEEICKMTREDAEKRIEELKIKLKRRITTNSNRFYKGNARIQKECDEHNHTEISYLIGEIALLTNEFFGIKELVPTMNEIVFIQHKFLLDQYCENEKSEDINV